MMVNNVQSSCDEMSAFWRNASLDFLPPSAKVLGVWGENLDAWILAGPGGVAGDGGAADPPLYEWAAAGGAGLGIWQWWSGDTTHLASVVEQVMRYD